MMRCCISCRESNFNCLSCFILLQGKDGFLGRCVISPMVRLEGHQTPEPRLQWHKIRRGEEEGGELLATCELFLVSLSCFVSLLFLTHLLLIIFCCPLNQTVGCKVFLQLFCPTIRHN